MLSSAFIVTTVVALLAYHLAAPRARVAVLLVASYGFYAFAAPAFLPLLVGVTAVAFVGAMVIERSPSRLVLVSSIALLLGGLVWLRAEYRGNPLVGPFAAIGASFYVLQATAYVADRYNGVRDSRLSLSELAVYLAYFPKLLAGPIERAARFGAQLRAPSVVDDDQLARACGLIALGLFRKLVIADPLRAAIPWEATNDPAQLSSLALVVSLLAFGIALYNDFAAYTGIARGLSLLFGIELSANFAQPLLASGFSDFWNRWHATLTHWLRDYVYLPASRSVLRRVGKLRHPANLLAPPLLTMVASGLWHGVTVPMVVWGACQGLLLAFERAFLLRPGSSFTVLRRLVGVLLLWGAGLPLAILFLVPDVTMAADYCSSMIAGQEGLFPIDPYLAPLPIASFLIDLAQRRSGELFFWRWPRIARALVLAIASLACFVQIISRPVPAFVYQGF